VRTAVKRSVIEFPVGVRLALVELVEHPEVSVFGIVVRRQVPEDLCEVPEFCEELLHLWCSAAQRCEVRLDVAEEQTSIEGCSLAQPAVIRRSPRRSRIVVRVCKL
jgi:hypothetical protein